MTATEELIRILDSEFESDEVYFNIQEICNMAKSLEVYLTEAYKQFIYINIFEYQKSKKVFDVVFDTVKKEMDTHSTYFKENAKQVMNAGSVHNRVKISKLNEFDLDIVVRLPVAARALAVQPGEPAFVSLQVGQEFEDLKKQKKFPDSYKVLHDWRDHDNYILQDKFRQWLHGIVDKALNTLNHQVTVGDKKYSVKYTVSGPAYTLVIDAEPGSPEFHLDVDLVPVFRFQHPKWPGGDYRSLPESITKSTKDWLAVPKPNKDFTCDTKRSRHWRLSFQEFERVLMKDGQRLKPTFRLIKKLRDALELKEIASYYINTLFLWKIEAEETNSNFWHKSLSELFCIMVENLYKAIEAKNIPYFWHNKNKPYNLIGHISDHVLEKYKRQLQRVYGYVLAQDTDKIISCLLTKSELEVFKAPQPTGYIHNEPSALDILSNVIPPNDSCVRASVSTEVPKASESASPSKEALQQETEKLTKKVEPNEREKEESYRAPKPSKFRKAFMPALLGAAMLFGTTGATGPATVQYDTPAHTYVMQAPSNNFRTDVLYAKKPTSTAIPNVNESNQSSVPSAGENTGEASKQESSSHKTQFASEKKEDESSWIFCTDVIQLNHFEDEFDW